MLSTPPENIALPNSRKFHKLKDDDFDKYRMLLVQKLGVLQCCPSQFQHESVDELYEAFLQSLDSVKTEI